MIVSVTPNPSLDRTYEVPAVLRGEVLRASVVRVDPGGKGINVSLALAATGHATRAIVPLGGHEGEQLRAALGKAGIEVASVPVLGELRTNISLVEPDGVVTKVNAPGPALDETELAALSATISAQITDACWIVGSGSLPPGTPETFYADFVAIGGDAGVRVAIDASGGALAAAVRAGPDLVKPNVHELAELTGRRLETLGDVVSAAGLVRGHGVGVVVVSLGRDGAVLVDAEGAWYASTPPIPVRSAVGAGDALVAGLLVEDALGPEALRLGVAYGSAAAALPGTQFPSAADLDIERVTVGAVTAEQQLTERGGMQ